jgi:hypothetical protein
MCRDIKASKHCTSILRLTHHPTTMPTVQNWLVSAIYCKNPAVMADAWSDNPRRPSLKRVVSCSLAVALVVVQCLASAHLHPKQTRSVYGSAVTDLDDGGQCALCSYHQYFPALSPIASTLPLGAAIGEVELYAAQSTPLYAFNSYLSGRSPPPTG